MNSQLPQDFSGELPHNMQRGEPDDNIPPKVKEAMKELTPEKSYKSAANNFYTIAVLSLVNSVISVSGGRFVFVIGLGITQLIDGIAYVLRQEISEASTFIIAVALILDLGACGVVGLFGYFASKQKNWAIVVGMLLYGLDALLTLIFKDWIGFAFHLFFIWQIWMIYRILGYWKKIKKPTDFTTQNFSVS